VVGIWQRDEVGVPLERNIRRGECIKKCKAEKGYRGKGALPWSKGRRKPEGIVTPDSRSGTTIRVVCGDSPANELRGGEAWRCVQP